MLTLSKENLDQLGSVLDYDAIGRAILAQASANAPGRQAASKSLTGWKHDVSGQPSASGFMHGPGGLLRYPGVDPAVFQTIVGSMGILSETQFTPTTYVNPTYETLTGITGDEVDQGGSEPAEICDDAPTSGQKKGCIVQAPFGRYKRGTREVAMERLGQRVDRADPLDLFLVGSPINNPAFPGAGNLEGMSFSPDVLVNEWSNIVSDRAVAMHRKLARQVWQGTPLNNNVGQGYKEFAGLATLINTGYQDLLTGDRCESMDSDVWDFQSNRIDGSVQNAAALVNTIQYLFRTRRNLAMRTGVDPVRFAFCMQEPLFYELTKVGVWPTAYLIGATTVIDVAGQRVTMDAKDAIDMRDQMRAGRYLILDGIQVPVIFDDGIPITNEAERGCFASSIFLVPFSVMGGRLTYYGEYFQYQNPSVQSVLGLPVLARVVGPFFETPRQSNTCIVFDILIEPRVILRTPWLAGRIDNIVFCPAEFTRQPFPGDDYFVNGGVVGTRPGPDYSTNNVWN
jgi:hypothetical protein